jgi:hypothetical protein
MTLAICLVLLLAGSQRVRATGWYNRFYAPPTELLESTGHVVVDNVGRGGLPRVLWFCPDYVNTFVADQETLLDRRGSWVDQLVLPALYVSPLARDSTDDARRSILAHLDARYGVVRVQHMFWDLGPAFWILPRE